MRYRPLATIALAAAAATLLGSVRQRRTRRFDVILLASLRDKGPRDVRKAAALTATPAAVLAQASVVAAVVARNHPRLAVCIVGAPALAVGASWMVKHAFDRARPPWHLFERKGMQSFPSSHTAGKGALLWILATCCPGSPATRASAFFLAAADGAVSQPAGRPLNQLRHIRRASACFCERRRCSCTIAP
jgi:membrane-associated phospholipid phosphatase